MGAGGRRAQVRHQRAKLRPLQNLRHQRPESEHHLGSARRRRRPELSEYVTPRGSLKPRCCPVQGLQAWKRRRRGILAGFVQKGHRSEEHTSELQSRLHLVCRLLLEKKKKK